jgi:hypothetical protein
MRRARALVPALVARVIGGGDEMDDRRPGSNGSGKVTAMRMLLSVARPTPGSVGSVVEAEEAEVPQEGQGGEQGDRDPGVVQPTDGRAHIAAP